ncbi:MAG: lipoprotein signal peptidase [Drouetiella hepatica Uher 2000/2452]|jgi:signal peptidase II|uniref:Lipoprotein signal peptidase n=1 Tax=Drouetiella hepatica Uher 2000/2452 TaxID=904376 RepID=A0A951QCK4_9CYAN|nr:lipoprotein signal peptidase [Drouetiella hepatica Uher 2000/2452]
MNLKNRLFWVTAAVGLVLDQLSKFAIVQNFQIGETLALIPGVFHFTYVVNKGAAFSLFSERGEWLRWLSLIVSAGLILLAWRTRMNRLEQVGYGCVLAGALGNGIDRFTAGQVVDFLDLRIIRFAVFNLADVFINIGIFCLLVAAFQQPPRKDSRHTADK